MDDKTEGKIASSQINYKFELAGSLDNQVYTPRTPNISPKFFHHFTCQRIFADKSFGNVINFLFLFKEYRIFFKFKMFFNPYFSFN